MRSVDGSRHFLPFFLREIADGAVHLGADELGLIGGIFATVRGVIAEGTRQKLFQPVNPALAHFTIIGPLVMFRATAPVRERIRLTQRIDIPDVESARAHRPSADGRAPHAGAGNEDRGSDMTTDCQCLLLLMPSDSAGCTRGATSGPPARVRPGGSHRGAGGAGSGRPGAGHSRRRRRSDQEGRSHRDARYARR